MRVWTCIDHDTRWPVGGASVVVAPTKAKAREVLRAALDKAGIGSDDFTLQELPTNKSLAIVLRDGDY